eukprot:8233245-Alexandrium_andersonii.AAC.1
MEAAAQVLRNLRSKHGLAFRQCLHGCEDPLKFEATSLRVQTESRSYRGCAEQREPWSVRPRARGPACA